MRNDGIHLGGDVGRMRATRRGSALVVCLAAVLGMAALCAGILQFSGRVAREQATTIDDLRALYAAESGLAEAYLALSEGKDGNVGSAENPAAYGGGMYWVEASDVGGGRVALSSTGLVGTGASGSSTCPTRSSSPPCASGSPSCHSSARSCSVGARALPAFRARWRASTPSTSYSPSI